jgi:hypothetical protein
MVQIRNLTDDKTSKDASGNESDYDNNLPVRVNDNSQSSTRCTRIDDVQLGDQNEIILRNDAHIETMNKPIDSCHSQQSDRNPITYDETLSYQPDSSINRRLMTIRSQLLSSPDLDAT